MKINVLNESYEVQSETVLQALEEIKKEQNRSLSYRKGCGSGICGSCSVRVNGKEQLACTCKLEGGEKIEALKYHYVIKDLVVDLEKPQDTLKTAKANLSEDLGKPDAKDEKKVRVQSDCILCHSCYSSCPVLEVNKDFLGPFSLTRVFRYNSLSTEGDKKSKIEAVQTNGVWDCTLCGECAMVCPMGINPKNDIMGLRMQSQAQGFSDPNIQLGGFDNNFGGGGFNTSFNTGFNPNF
ncbi:MAG: 2Fe-2S iron-sulfur cluster-binding protein [Campylobacterales bacterium]|nr:2Fe-2S iron-sulfur cluster-binding protein [Campylobacterales bacterium]